MLTQHCYCHYITSYINKALLCYR